MRISTVGFNSHEILSRRAFFRQITGEQQLFVYNNMEEIIEKKSDLVILNAQKEFAFIGITLDELEKNYLRVMLYSERKPNPHFLRMCSKKKENIIAVCIREDETEKCRDAVQKSKGYISIEGSIILRRPETKYERGIEELTLMQRTILFYLMQGKSVKFIAEKIGTSVESVRNAKVNIKKTLKGEFGDTNLMELSSWLLF